MEWLPRLRPGRRVQKVHAKYGPAGEAIVIAIDVGAVEAGVPVAAQEVTVGAIPAAVVDADEGRISSRFPVLDKGEGPQRCGLFLF
jgi:hypothetical protein